MFIINEIDLENLMMSTIPTIRANIQPNPVTSFNRRSWYPMIPPSSTVHHRATVIGPVIMGNNAFVAPSAVVRADEGTPMFIGDNSNIQDGAVIHGLKNKPNETYSVVIGSNVSVAHQALVHGPAYVGDNSFVGFQALVFKAVVGKGCVLEPGAKVMNCHVPDGRYVPANQVVDTQEKANALPVITDSYANKHLNDEVVEVNKELSNGYGMMYQSIYSNGPRNTQMPYYPSMPIIHN